MREIFIIQSAFPQPQTGVRAPLAFRVGDTIRAMVLDVRLDGTALIKVRDTVVEAKATLPVEKGDVLNLRVDRQGETVILKPALAPGSETADLRTTILGALKQLGTLRAASVEIANLAAEMKKLPEAVLQKLPDLAAVLKHLPPADQMPKEGFAKLISESGLFLETKIRLIALRGGENGRSAAQDLHSVITNDLKARLLAAAEELAKPETAALLRGSNITPEELQSAVDRMVRTIEAHQLQTKLEERLHAFVPLAWERLKDGDLTFYDPGRGGPAGQSQWCSVNLDLEGAGKVRCDVLLQNGNVHVSLTADNESFSRLLREHGQQLEEQFAASGLRLSALTVRSGAPNEAPLLPGGLSIKV